MKIVMTAAALVLCGISSGCGNCQPTGPSGAGVPFSGSLGAGGVAFHDIAAPADTDSFRVSMQWNPPEARVRLTQIDPNCDPTQTPSCQAITDPQGPTPNGSPTSIDAYLSHQGDTASGRVRFMLQNSTEVPATYSGSATPTRHGCDR